MKKFLQSMVVFTLVIFGLWSVERISHQATDGFVISKIKYQLPPDPRWETNDEEQKIQNVNKILNQPFYYLDSGSQFYVFVSQDDRYILKFFKFQHMTVRPIIAYLPLFGSLKDWRENKMIKKKRLIDFTFESIKTAYKNLPQETGLEFIHLNCDRALFSSPVTIHDKIHIAHKIDLNSTCFIVQQKAKLAYPTIDHWMKRGEVEKAKQGISKLLRITINRSKKGLGDIDPNFRTNFGFIDDEACQIDIGRFYHNPQGKDPEQYRQEIIRNTRAFRQWIAENHPTLLTFFDDEIQALQ